MPGIKTLKRPTGNAYHGFRSHEPGAVNAWKPSKKQTKKLAKPTPKAERGH
jgi:hypothetical protein